MHIDKAGRWALVMVLLLVLLPVSGWGQENPTGNRKKQRPLPSEPKVNKKQAKAVTDRPGEEAEAAESEATEKPVAEKPTAEPANDDERNAKFTEMLSGVKLVGRFTVLGRDDRPPRQEEYTIRSVTHAGGKMWLFNTRIKYGDRDVTLPLLLPVEWAGDTPMISFTDFAIPVLGTFSARVVFNDGMYAGTWKHDAVGGHLFGVIEKLPADDEAEKAKAEEPGAREN